MNFLLLTLWAVLCPLVASRTLNHGGSPILNSVRVFIVQEESFNYLQKYLKLHELKRKKLVQEMESLGNIVVPDERKIAIIMGVPKKKRDLEAEVDEREIEEREKEISNIEDERRERMDKGLPPHMKGFHESDRRLDEEEMTSPAEIVVAPPNRHFYHDEEAAASSEVAVPVQPTFDDRLGLADQYGPYYDQPYLEPPRPVLERRQLFAPPQVVNAPQPEIDLRPIDDPRSFSDEEMELDELTRPFIPVRQSYFPFKQVMYHLFKKKK